VNRLLIGLLTLLLLGPALGAQDENKDKPKEKPKDEKAKIEKPATPAEQYRALAKEAQDAQQEFMKAYRAAKTQEARNKMFQEKYPQPAKYAGRMVALADKNPTDPAAVDALVWVMSNAPFSKEVDKAAQVLFEDHADSKQLAQVCQVLPNTGVKKKDTYLRQALEKSPHHDVQGFACFNLAMSLKNAADGAGLKQADLVKKNKEAGDLFDRVVKDFGDVKLRGEALAEGAKSNLFEIRNLAIGKTSPDLEGEDSDGKKFKLSDYRGKVVVLDFWARW
jgi:hypothetical protein